MEQSLNGHPICLVYHRALSWVRCSFRYIFINDIMVDIDSEIRLFVDDCVCYRQIHSIDNTVKLQRVINRLGRWARKWGMRFQPTKRNMMQLTRDQVKKFIVTYTLERTVLENVDRIKYFGVTITNDFRWKTHIGNICTKANRILGFLRRNISSRPIDVKEMAYKGLVRPILEYASLVWDPSGKALQDELKKVQNRAARFVTGYYSFETRSMTKELEQLKWESLKQRRKGSRLILFYEGLEDQANIPVDDLKPLLGTLETIIQNHCNSLMLGLMPISIVSFPKLLEIRMHSLHLLYPLLNVLRIAYLDSHHCKSVISLFCSLPKSGTFYVYHFVSIYNVKTRAS